MKTTVDIDGDLLIQATKRAVLTNRSLSAVIEDALRSELARVAPDQSRNSTPAVVTFKGDGVQPGINLDHSSGLLDLVEEIE